MKALQSQYEVTDMMSGVIGKIVEDISFDRQGSQTETSSTNSWADSGPFPSNAIEDLSVINYWGNVLLRQPILYLRLAITMDLTMSKGVIPEDADFPWPLQAKNKLVISYPPCRVAVGGEGNMGAFNFRERDTREFGGGIYEEMNDTGTSVIASLHRPLDFMSEEMTSAMEKDNMDYDPSVFELPMGFEASDIELPSQLDFEFDSPEAWANDTTAFQDQR